RSRGWRELFPYHRVFTSTLPGTAPAGLRRLHTLPFRQCRPRRRGRHWRRHALPFRTDPPMTRMSRPVKFLLLAGLCLAVLLAWRACSNGDADQDGPGGAGWGDGRPPTAVRVVPAERGPLEVELKALGTVTPLRTVTVRSRVEGELLR